MGTKLHNIPVTMDDAFLAEIDAIAGARGESRSQVMRRAVRAGLPVVQSGENSELVPLDSELRADVGKLAEIHGISRGKALYESVRAGIHAVHARLSTRTAADTAEAALFEALLAHDPEASALGRDYLKARRTIESLRDLVSDLRRMVPGAAVRLAAMERLTELRATRGRGGGTPLGLTQEEIEAQIRTLEAAPLRTDPLGKLAVDEAARTNPDAPKVPPGPKKRGK